MVSDLLRFSFPLPLSFFPLEGADAADTDADGGTKDSTAFCAYAVVNFLAGACAVSRARRDSWTRAANLAAAASAWVADARRRLRPGGRLVCLDYADGTAALASRPWTDWVRAFAGHERVPGPFAGPGTRDVTVVVPWDQLPPADQVCDQATWLRGHGIDDLVEAGRRHWAEHAAAPDLAAMAMRSRVAEAEALLDPAGPGAFTVGEWRARA